MLRDGGRFAARETRATSVDPDVSGRLDALEQRLNQVERDRHDELVEIEGRISQALAARFRDEIAALRADVRRLSGARR